MSVDTKRITGRRSLDFETLDDLSIEVERLAPHEVKLLGNWTLAQIFTHLAVALNSAVDGSTFKAPWFLKLLAPVLRKKFIYGKMPSGFKIPQKAQAQFLPSDAAELEVARTQLLEAISRLKEAASGDLAEHPLFGKISKDEATQFHLRHSEMHLSFVIPMDSTT